MTLGTRSNWLLGGTALIALAATADARAQATQVAPNLDEVVVTGSRAIKDGSRSPTPLTVISAVESRTFGAGNIADTLSQVPQFRASPGAGNNGPGSTYPGQSFLNLRGIGPTRTLVLVNGRRFVTTTDGRGVDANVIPQALISRVEVVTGGASAAYGSDAVSGVMNFVLDTGFNGLKGDAQYGVSDLGDDANYKASLTAGSSFLEGRAHVVLSGEFARSDGIHGHAYDPETKRPWLGEGVVRVPNPAVTAANPASLSNPKTILLSNVRLAVANYNGVIQSGPFANMQFTAAGGVIPFNPGSPRSGTNATGGDGWNFIQMQALDNPLTRNNFYGHVKFDVTPNITAFADVTSGYAHSRVRTAPSLYTQTNFTSGFPIKIDNPYLSPAFQAQMAAAGVTQVLVNVVSRQLPIRNIETYNDTKQGTVGFEGKLGKRWNWEAYYIYGENRGELNGINNTILGNFLLATDAVRNPATGQIACRSTLTNPTNGCLPVNIIGDNPIPEATRKYFQGDMRSGSTTTLEAMEATIRGDLFTLPAGELSVAAGASWMKQALSRVSDPIAQGTNPITGRNTGGWLATNVQPVNGEISDSEFFAEAAAPLLSDLPLVKSLDVNAAIRYTDYSLSGGVTTWKIGAVYAPFDDLRLRATRSRDIRAPGISELFQGTQQLVETVIDSSLPGSPAYTVLAFLTGNDALKPEAADTLTYGAVYQPSWAPGATLSVDAYRIDIKDAISTLTSQQIFDQCQARVATACALISRDAGTGRIGSVLRPNLNSAKVKISGIDIELGYERALSDLISGVDGTLRFRMIGNYLGKYTNVTVPGAPLQHFTGGGDRPKWMANFTLGYDRGPLSLDVRTRWVGSQKKILDLTAIDLAPRDNRVKDFFYTDLAARYKFEAGGSHYEVFGVVGNIFQPKPPLIPTGFAQASTNLFLYDAIGRTYKVGMRFSY